MSARRVVGLLASWALGGVAAGQFTAAPPLPEIDWEQHPGAQLPLDATFTTSAGAVVTLGDVCGERPVLLALVYYQCPMLCNLLMEGLVRALKAVSFDVGTEFDVVSISIDPGETPALAAAKKTGYVKRYGRAETADGWHFLVGDEEAIASVAEAIGFRFTYVPATDEYAHPAGITLATPDGRVARTFFGTEFSPRDLRFGLIEASEGKIGGAVDKVLLRCFAYDPAKGRYGFAILAAIRTGGLLTVAVLAAFVLRWLLRERRSHRPVPREGVV